MKQRNVLTSLLLAGAMLLSACGAPAASSAPAVSAAPASSDAALSPSEQWALDNGLDKTETPEELYKKALAAGGEVNIYTVSGRMQRVKEAFEKDYPGMTLVVHDMNVNELLEKYNREYEAGIHTADVIHLKEQTGEILKEYVQTGMMHNYHPSDIYGKVDEKFLALTPMYFEADWWYFNTEVYKESPIDSWWDLTRPEWKGKFLCVDPMSDIGYMALLTTIIENSDLMAKAYEEEFGTPIVLAADEPDAGHAFLKRFAQNRPVFETSSNGVVKAVGASGQSDPPVGYAVSSKLRERDEQGYPLGVDPLNFKPAVGIYGMNIVEIADGAPNPDGAKLVVRYLAGEADGNGNGFAPYNTVGGWSIRRDGPSAKGNVPFEEVKTFPQDMEYTYQHIKEVQDYWVSVQP
ncbi:ABC transporter substrate-binding protein [Yanshouia hominis]|uniref:ABC transporter substrate-binding protein n=1 Tax=Yanshouia hominis TaxID=2763673 RepID=A0ABR7NNA2_9FIRM|nr:ABC transporter substrate-binding protein [Yanshouia hominis]MBC8577784.1 ABC transporter substrate-binding protein [Yanshouia hominis]